MLVKDIVIRLLKLDAYYNRVHFKIKVFTGDEDNPYRECDAEFRDVRRIWPVNYQQEIVIELDLDLPKGERLCQQEEET